MSWKRYQNELMVLAAFTVMLLTIFYKSGQISSQAEEVVNSEKAIAQFKEVAALKRVWVDKRTSNKVEKLKLMVDASKVEWTKKGKSLTAVYQTLNSKELNRLVSTVMNLGVEIKEIDIKKEETTYKVTLKCKW